jgi:L-arabinonolactonase
MYYADSGTREIRCCDYDPVTGAISNLREFAAADAAPGDPDGSTIDADGYLWSTRWGAGQVVRFAPDGTVDRVLTVQAPQPTCPAFGGRDLDVLYVTSATVGLRAGQLADAPKSGGVFAKTLQIRGLPEVRFAGNR